MYHAFEKNCVCLSEEKERTEEKKNNTEKKVETLPPLKPNGEEGKWKS